jgi:hypothetical protein
MSHTDANSFFYLLYNSALILTYRVFTQIQMRTVANSSSEKVSGEWGGVAL